MISLVKVRVCGRPTGWIEESRRPPDFRGGSLASLADRMPRPSQELAPVSRGTVVKIMRVASGHFRLANSACTRRSTSSVAALPSQGGAFELRPQRWTFVPESEQFQPFTLFLGFPHLEARGPDLCVLRLLTLKLVISSRSLEFLPSLDASSIDSAQPTTATSRRAIKHLRTKRTEHARP